MCNRLTNELAVCGFNAVQALGMQHPDQIKRLFLREDRLAALASICKVMAARKLPYKICDDEELEHLCKGNRHQGVVAMIQEREITPMDPTDLDAWIKEGWTGILLDSVGSDNNLGAIVRSAAFFGTRIIILSERDKEARLSTGVYRVAEGGMEYVTFRSVRNPAAFLQDSVKKITVLGADHRARLRLQDLSTVFGSMKTPFKSGTLLVLGNEETGLSTELKEQCTTLIRIPGTGDIESLNIAQTAALMLHGIYSLC